MPPTRKIRCDRWDASLTDEQRWRAYDVFRRSLWAEFLAWAETQLPGVALPGRNALYDWARDMRSREATHRLRQAAEARDEVGGLAATAALDTDLAAAYKSLAATAALSGDRETAVELTKMALGLAAQQMDAARIKLQRDKFTAAERRLQAVREALSSPKSADGGLSPETLKKIEDAAGLL